MHFVICIIAQDLWDSNSKNIKANNKWKQLPQNLYNILIGESTYSKELWYMILCNYTIFQFPPFSSFRIWYLNNNLVLWSKKVKFYTVDYVKYKLMKPDKFS